MASNIVRTWNDKTIRQREDGYLSATDMAQACGKQVGHWLSNKSTKELIARFYTRYRISDNDCTEPVSVIQGGIPEDQGTWLHSKIAIQFAQWCNPDFALQVSDWVEELMTAGTVSIADQPPVRSLPAYHEAAQTFDFMSHVGKALIDAGLNPLLVSAHAISQTARLHPDVSPQLEAMKALIPQQEQLQLTESLLTPTEIGKRLDPQLSPQRVNLLLTGMGLQLRTGIKDHPYELTDLGKEYGRVTLNQAKASDKTVQHIKWKSSVVELLSKAS